MCLRNSSADDGVSSSPSMLMCPSSSGWKPRMACRSVVLPLPELPVRQTVCPSGTVNDRPAKSCLPPMVMDASLISSIVGFCFCCLSDALCCRRGQSRRLSGYVLSYAKVLKNNQWMACSVPFLQKRSWLPALT